MEIVLIAGYAGSGKTEVAKALASRFGWALLDKDTLTRPLLDLAASLLCGNPNDRHSPKYVDLLRPLEYQCLMDTMWEVVRHGSSVVVTAPFLLEVASSDWCSELDFEASFAGAHVQWVWVHSDMATMRNRLTHRRALRDEWKLANWPSYASTVDIDLRPCAESPYVAMNSAGSSLPLVVEDLIDHIERSSA